MTDRGRPGFVGNVMKAHQVLAHRKGSIGVTGEEMTKLLSLVCHKFPPKISEIVLKIVLSGQHDPTDIIEFDVFFLSVSVCLLFVEQIEFAKQYFASMYLEDVVQKEVEGVQIDKLNNSGEGGVDQARSRYGGTRPATFNLEQRASVGSLLKFLRRKQEEQNFSMSLATCSGRSLEQIDLVALEKGLLKVAKASQTNDVNIEEFCILLVMQAAPNDV